MYVLTAGLIELSFKVHLSAYARMFSSMNVCMYVCMYESMYACMHGRCMHV